MLQYSHMKYSVCVFCILSTFGVRCDINKEFISCTKTNVHFVIFLYKLFSYIFYRPTAEICKLSFCFGSKI